MNVQEMSNYRAVALAEGFEDGSEDEVQAAWQAIYDRGLYRSLQGFFGRNVAAMLESGYIVDQHVEVN
jgi:hypothetical protein